MKHYAFYMLFSASVFFNLSSQAMETDLEGKTRLLCGGIVEGAVPTTIESLSCVVANAFSEVCEENDFAINLHESSKCHLVGDLWDFKTILGENPALKRHSFKSIYFNHIGDGFWSDHFTEEERIKSKIKETVKKDVAEKIKNLFAPLVSVLGKGGDFVYQSFVNDWLEDFGLDKQLQFLTKDVLKKCPKSINEREYSSVSDGRMKRVETSYSLKEIENPIIQGYFTALKELGFSNASVEVVFADRTPLKSEINLRIPCVEEITKKEDYRKGIRPFVIYDTFLRLKGIK